MPDIIIIIIIMIDNGRGIAVCTLRGMKVTAVKTNPDRSLSDVASCTRRPEIFTLWVSNPWPSDRMQPALLSYAPRGHICKVCMYCKTYVLIWATRFTTYCYFSKCGPRNCPQKRVWTFTLKSWKPIFHMHFIKRVRDYFWLPVIRTAF